MPRRPFADRMLRTTRPYAIAFALLAGAVVLRIPLAALLGMTQPWLTFWPAAFLAAWWGGVRAGVVTITGAVVLAHYVLLPPIGELTLSQRSLVGASVFVIGSVGFVWVAEKARRARKAEAQAMRAKDEFLAILGHELRNPLAPISTAIELMRMHGQRSRELEVIERQVGHMVRLVDDLLDVTRLVRGTIELRKSHVDLRTVIDRAVESAGPLLERRGNPLRVDVPAGIIIDGDARRLTQAFGNLVNNAIKFSKHEMPIEIRSERHGGNVRVHVIDRGSGIRPDLLPRLFEPFVQEVQQIDRAAGGLGLGLVIARKIVELHGGTIAAWSEGEGRGARLTIELPVLAEVAPLVEPALPDQPQPQRILVIDDNEDVAGLLSSLLEKWGHEVCVAHDGPQGLKLAETFSPTLALVDIGLPVMSGYEVARQLRERGIDVPMIAVTGYGQDKDREESKAAGFAEHLVKPVDLSRLGKVIERYSTPHT